MPSQRTQLTKHLEHTAGTVRFACRWQQHERKALTSAASSSTDARALMQAQALGAWPDSKCVPLRLRLWACRALLPSSRLSRPVLFTPNWATSVTYRLDACSEGQGREHGLEACAPQAGQQRRYLVWLDRGRP